MKTKILNIYEQMRALSPYVDNKFILLNEKLFENM